MQHEYSTLESPETASHTAGIPSATDTPREWLEHFPGPRRSAVANWYYAAVRHGAVTPAAVVHQVLQTVQRRLQWVSDPAATAHLQTVQEALQSDRAGALAFAQAVLDWEALPYAERQQRKAERGRHFQQEYMARMPVTPQQQAFLRTLGYTEEPPTNRLEASTLIDTLLSARKGGRP